MRIHIRPSRTQGGEEAALRGNERGRGTIIETNPERHRDATLREYLGILWLRKWLVLLNVLLVPAAAVFYSLEQERLYESSASVLVKNQDLAALLSGLGDIYIDPDRFLDNQVEVARSAAVAERAVAAVDRVRSGDELLGSSAVFASPDTDVLTFSVTDRESVLAELLANAYAQGFIAYRRQSESAAIQTALRQLDRRITQFGGPPRRTSPLYDSYGTLVDQREQLRTLGALQTTNATLLHRAEGAAQVQPKPIRNGIVGVGLGIILALGLALLAHALDTRVRTADEIAHRLALPLLARIPAPRRRLRDRDQIAMLADPHGAMAEAFRVLRTNVEFASLERDVKTILVTSARQGEGKSTTVANLAVAFARAGRDVAVVDLDLRRPSLHEFFGTLGGAGGITHVALGHATLEDVLTPIPLSGAGKAGKEKTLAFSSNGDAGGSGRLTFLSAGPAPPNPGEFVGSETVGQILRKLRDRFDLVLVDAPPLLAVGDASALSSRMDGILIVARLKVIDRRTLNELQRTLSSSPAAALGFILTDAAGVEDYGYTYAPKRRSQAAAPAPAPARLTSTEQSPERSP